MTIQKVFLKTATATVVIMAFCQLLTPHTNAAEKRPLDYRIELTTARKGFDGKNAGCTPGLDYPAGHHAATRATIPSW